MTFPAQQKPELKIKHAKKRQSEWYLGFQPPNMRAATVGTIDFSGTISLDTFVTGSPSSLTYSSTSDFETESTASFFHDKGMTLGSLIGASSILERSSGRSVRRRRLNNAKGEKNDKCKPCSSLYVPAATSTPRGLHLYAII
ncbi:hypothetical protein Sjap_012283 [Stephania japonica]|uniref:Uncharacterized protein n=1 Tax=Stephania japonica TaxID=461633 RepID=A0AAP0P069_9MAGN